MSEHDTNKSDLDTPADQAVTADQGTTSGADSAIGVDATNSADPTIGTDAVNSADPAVGADAAVNLDASGGFDPIGYLDTVINFFQTGGAFMYPILVVFSLGLAISIERYIKLTYEREINRRMWNKLQPVLAEADFPKAREMVTKDKKSTISKLMLMGLERQGVVRRREDIEIAMEETMMEIIPQLEKRTPFIALFSNICTLLGLLGTIMGLIEAFTAVANANPAEKADMLSASISVAMNTTAFGLMAGIPLLIIHAVLTSRTGEIVNGLEMASVKTLNVISSAAIRKIDTVKHTTDSSLFTLPIEETTESTISDEDSTNTDESEKSD
jgi:biopolymer transport protein ExbB